VAGSTDNDRQCDLFGESPEGPLTYSAGVAAALAGLYCDAGPAGKCQPLAGDVSGNRHLSR